MRWFEQIRGEYRPQRTDDLREGVAESIGRVSTWMAAWTIEEGPYEGQFAMMPDVHDGFPFAWAPLCDVKPIPEETDHGKL